VNAGRAQDLCLLADHERRLTAGQNRSRYVAGLVLEAAGRAALAK
jgi:hypothetical protein